MLIQLKEILDNHHPKTYFRIIKSNPKLYQLVTEFQKMNNLQNFAEALYCLYHNMLPKFCVCGKKCKFNTFVKGYREVCSVKCKQTLHAEKLKSFWENNPTKLTDMIQKRDQTNLAKYGYSNAALNQTVKEKTKQTCLQRYGTEFPLQSEEVQDKIKVNCLQKYGVKSPLSSEVFQDKARKTFVERHGPQKMQFARAAWPNGANPFTWPAVQEKIKKYLQEKESSSSYEVEIAIWLTENNVTFERNNRTICEGKEVDFYLPDYNLAIEFNGLYWHCDIYRDSKYHKLKFDLCAKNNIRLLTIFEDEWNEHKDTIKSHILHLCKQTKTNIGARKCQIKPIDFQITQKFLGQHHIQGVTGRFSISLGAFHNDVLMAVVTLSKMKKVNEYDMTRYAINQTYSYPGLFSKFLSYIQNNYPQIKEIITFADLRWSIGDVYLKTGFVIDSYLKPGYCYTDFKQRFHKFNFRKNKLASRFGVDITGKTERQLMEELDFARLWDCGKIKFRKVL